MSESTQSLRVLYVVSLFPCWSETFIVREIEQLIARGVDVRILSLKAPSERMVQSRAEALLPRTMHPASTAQTVLRVLAECARHPLVMLSVFLRTLGLWRQPVVLAKTWVALARAIGRLDEVRAFAPNYVHAHWATYPSTVAWCLGRLLRKPYGFTCHAHDIFVDDQLLRLKLATARLAVTISQFNVRHLRPWASPGAREPVVIHCGVDLDEMPFTPEGRVADELLAVGRLDPIKGFAVLIRAMARVKAAGVPARLTVIGEGPERAALEELVRACDVADRVSLPGARPQEGVRAAMRSANLFVLPSVVTPDGNRDGIPVALMEAMACGTPVLSTTVSGIPELIADGVEGRLVAPDNDEALAHAIIEMLADAPARERWTRAARARITREFDARLEAGRLLGEIQARCHD